VESVVEARHFDIPPKIRGGDKLLIDLHVHSRYSPDSLIAPKTILKVAKKRGLDGVAVTDHHTIRGGLETLRVNRDPHFLVIVGSEIETDCGDIIGLFLVEEIRSREAHEVLKEIKEQNGVALWAHPYRAGKNLLPHALIKQVDLIEGSNAKTAESDNVRARSLAARYRKPVVGTSDAHSESEIGNVATLVDCSSIDYVKEALTKGETRIVGFKRGYERDRKPSKKRLRLPYSRDRPSL